MRINTTEIKTVTEFLLQTKDDNYLIKWERLQTHHADDIRHTVQAFESNLTGGYVLIPGSTTILFNWKPTEKRSKSFLKQILKERRAA